MTTSPPFTPRRRSVVLGAAGALAGIATAAAPAHAGGLARAAGVRRWVEETLQRMSVEEKVGQLLVTHVYGADAHTPDSRNTSEYGVATAAEVVAKYRLGGVCYFTWSDNIADPRQVARLSNGLQEAALTSGAGVPLLISTDQEQGTIVRVGPPATQFPGNQGLAAGRDVAAARRAAAITGRELAALGINQDYAPVADVNVNPANPVIGVRSFGSDPALAAAFTAAQVAGYERDGGVIATAKHFPGHGDTQVDSHVGIPEIRHTREEWERIDAPPFRAAIEAGIGAVMTGHLVFPELDPSGDPATLSYPIITGLLREELGFDGVVITDSLGMRGVRDKYGDDRVVVLAINAGVDMLLRPPQFDLAYQALLEAVHSGEISPERLDEAVGRILRLKAERGIVHDPFVDVDQAAARVGTRAHLAQADRITVATTTVVKNDAGLLPLAPGPRAVLVTGASAVPVAEFAAAFAARGATPTTHPTGTQPSDSAIATAVARARESELALVVTYKAWDTEVTDPQGRQRRLVGELLATGVPLIVVAVHDPYDIAHVDEAPTYLATYAPNAVATQAAARVIFGEVAPRGRLPVPIPRADDPAQILYPYGHGLTW
ncbi:glycoside hydrolase family 3 protein [Thermasporomyces composti]|jgi:beta-N-acetylhexosaminidase|uniref:beta-N-acetylhexosaminidase n=1 Tax=Thermasporomyces composti TaxID=696763 RepID=A0A3D9VEL0_THECX|nr:glycoside hydrolase family 3 protein [Thermasporomyces composti]REF37565.1 beta-N-acetylhexosaminidase [Thermasporomyces composti]